MSALRLGNLILDVPMFQAALSGYSDSAMRRLAKDFGAPLVLTGVILAKSAANPRVMRNRVFHPHEAEHPVGAQIMGEDVQSMTQAAKALSEIGYDLIDLNFACPAPKVLRRKRGGAMLCQPRLVSEIIKAVRQTVTCPLMVKLRVGVDHQPGSLDDFREIVDHAIAERVDALVIHGRTVSERFHGKADWEILAHVKRSYPLATIIGSGDLFDARTAVDRLKTSGLDGIVLARGAVGNPWLIRDVRALLEGRPLCPAPSLAEQRQTILRHFEMIRSLHRPQRKAVGYFRKFLVGYAKRHPQRKKALLTFMAAHTADELVAEVERWYKE